MLFQPSLPCGCVCSLLWAEVHFISILSVSAFVEEQRKFFLFSLSLVMWFSGSKKCQSPGQSRSLWDSLVDDNVIYVLAQMLPGEERERENEKIQVGSDSTVCVWLLSQFTSKLFSVCKGLLLYNKFIHEWLASEMQLQVSGLKCSIGLNVLSS